MLMLCFIINLKQCNIVMVGLLGQDSPKKKRDANLKGLSDYIKGKQIKIPELKD